MRHESSPSLNLPAAAMTAMVAVMLLAGSVAAAVAAGGWRTGAVAQDEDLGKFPFMNPRMVATVNHVHGLQLKSTGTASTEAAVNVDCDRGSSSASRAQTYRIPGGTRTVTLPLPLAGGRCNVDVDVTSDDRGTVNLTLQYR